MKRLISLICAFAIIISAVSITAAAQNDQDYIYDSIYEDVLSQLGFITPTISDTMTRYELSGILVKMLSYDTAYAGDDNPFTDIDIQNQQYPVMKSAYNLGILSGGGARPNDIVNYNEAVKMVVCAIGYEPYAPYKGGWPAAYQTIAAELDILDDVAADGTGISRDSIYALLYNAMHTDILVMDSVGTEGGYSTEKGRNILTYYHKLTVGEGILQGVCGLNMLSDTELSKGDVYIDDMLLEDKTTNSHKLVGYNTRYYYDSKTRELKAVSALDTEEVKLSSDMIYNYENNTIYAESDGTERKYKTSVSTKILYNGTLIDSFSEELLLNNNGEIRLIKNSSSNAYDVIIIKDIEIIVVGSVDYSKCVIYDYYDNHSLKLDVDDSDYSIIFKDELGNDMLVKELTRGDVISYSKSTDGKNIEAYYSNTEIIGTIDEVTVSDEGDTVIVIEGEAFTASENFASKENVKAGMSGAFRLSTDRRIGFVSLDGSAKYGYLVAGMKGNGLSGKYRLKLFSIDSEMLEFDIPEKITIDGDRVDAKDAYALLLNGDKIERQVIRYELSSNGELISIDTTTKGSKESANSLQLCFSSFVDKNGNDRLGEMKLTWRDKGMLGGKVPVNQSGPIFIVPLDDGASDENYLVTTPYKYFVHDNSYSVETYKADDRELISDIVLYKSDSASVSIPDSVDMAVVNNVSEVSVDGDKYTKISLFFEGALKEYLVKDDKVLKIKLNDSDSDFHKLDCGDVIRYEANDIGYINKIDLYYDRVGNRFKYAANENTSTLTASFRVAYGEVYNQVSGIIQFCKGAVPTVNASNLTYEDLECYKSENYDIYTYDSEERVNKLRLGSIADIGDYKTSGKGSRIVVQTRNGFDGTIIIYK